MSALCTLLVMDGPAVAGNALPSPEKHLRMRFRRGMELSSDEGTTPEASTDSDNDSAFDFSDDEMAGSKRGPPPTALPLEATPANAPSLEIGRWRHSRGSLSPPPRQLQRKQPLPRRVRFKLDDDNDKTTRSTTDQPVDYDEYVQLWGGQQRRAAMQESALLALGMMGPTASSTARGLHGKRRSFGGAAAAAATTGKSAIFTAPPPTSAFSPNGGYRSQKTARKAAWNKRTVVLPLGKSNANNVHDASRTSANTLANASVNVQAIARNSTPSSPKKRRMLPPSSMLRLRARGGGCGGDKSKRRTSRGVGNLAELFKAAAAVTTPGSGLAPPAPARPARSEPTPELTCEESLDVDAAMKPKGEVRTPICRLLVPCWPEGVEGYEEAGGWRRLGGATSQALPRGSR